MNEPVSSVGSYPSGLFQREEPDTRTPVWRLVVGWVLLAAGVFAFACYLWGALDTRNYVILSTHFGAPPSGVFVLLLFALLAYIVALPVRATVEQRRRSIIRTVLIILCVVALITAVFFHALGMFRYQPTIEATSPSGQRQAAYVQNWHNATLRIFSGSGLSKREVGSVGVLCGLLSQDKVVFAGDETLKVSTPYSDFSIPLDPRTGAPRAHFGPTCTSPLQ